MKEIKIQVGSGEAQGMDIRTGGEVHRLNLGGGIPIPVDNYEDLRNKPKINGVELIGDLDLMDDMEMDDAIAGAIEEQLPPMENMDIEALFQSVFGD